MKIAFTSSGQDLNAVIDPRFGRAAYFVIVDMERNDFTAVPNTQNLNLPQGAGIQAGKTIVENNADVLITGNCGPKAFRVLSAAGIKIVVGASGKISDALKTFQEGKLKYTESPNVEGHWV